MGQCIPSFNNNDNTQIYNNKNNIELLNNEIKELKIEVYKQQSQIIELISLIEYIDYDIDLINHRVNEIVKNVKKINEKDDYVILKITSTLDDQYKLHFKGINRNNNKKIYYTDKPPNPILDITTNDEQKLIFSDEYMSSTTTDYAIAHSTEIFEIHMYNRKKTPIQDFIRLKINYLDFFDVITVYTHNDQYDTGISLNLYTSNIVDITHKINYVKTHHLRSFNILL
jgi:hypothetical protein